VNEPTHIDLFSGIGGFAIAAQAAGFRTIGFSEVDEYASRILKRHWPTVPNYGDIRNARGIRADLVTGGFPCQPFSTAGKRGGARDDRALWPEMCRVIEEARPSWVLAENVPGIINMELDRVLSDLDRIGYTCWPVVIPACAVDAKHYRERVWILANSMRRGKPLGWDVGRVGREQELDAKPSLWEVASESPVLGVDARIPKRLHQPRCRALGNAIVPQVAQVLLEAMRKLL
jgi:DNA (cytosine-5)-methyltransferase 1